MARRLAIDTNLLVLLVVGQVSRDLIGKHKRCQSYSVSDFEILTRLLTRFERVMVTPNSATETSNLVAYGLNDPFRSQLQSALGLILAGADEIYLPSSEVGSSSYFVRLGLTDSVWLKVLDKDAVLLTDDNNLYVAALQSGANARLFSDVRKYH